MVKLQEAENQIVIDYEVYDRRPSDSEMLIAAIETHRAMLGRPPHMVAADAAFYSAKNETAAKAQGVKRVCIPDRSTKSPERKREQKKRWFRNGQRWRTGCEGRISVGKRRHGLNRCHYRVEVGMKRWVGLGVIDDNTTSAVPWKSRLNRGRRPPLSIRSSRPAAQPPAALALPPASLATIPKTPNLRRKVAIASAQRSAIESPALGPIAPTWAALAALGRSRIRTRAAFQLKRTACVSRYADLARTSE
jgi:hypothetical protein